MKVGDLVQHFFTEQIGIIMRHSEQNILNSIEVSWVTGGLAQWPAGPHWCSPKSLEVISESR